jgi:hypothetical protein
MSIPAIHDQPGKSFEVSSFFQKHASSQVPQEVRIDDYLNAYRTTGRPPVPVPQEPTNEQQRTLLSLPPLFKPYSTRDTGPASFAPPSFFNSSSGNPSVNRPPTPPAITNPADLPPAQEFMTTTSEVEVYQSISIMPMFRGFSSDVSVMPVARCLFFCVLYLVSHLCSVITGAALLRLPQG